MRERSPGVWELIVEAGRDPVTGRRRQVSRVFRGNARAAKKARAALLADVGRGKHTGTVTTLDELYREWLQELERKGRSPNTIHGYTKVYERNIQPTLGDKPLVKISTKTLTDLYGAHQRRGLGPRSIYQIHACLSSMFTQACRWGWRDSNPAQWAEPPSQPNDAPVVPTPDEIIRLVAEADASRCPDKGRAMFLAATTGVRRAELCGLRRSDVDFENLTLTIRRSIVALPRAEPAEIPTKNRQTRTVALDNASARLLREQLDFLEERCCDADGALETDPYVFSDSVDGAEPWRPDSVTQYFTRLRSRVGLDHLDFHYLRKFMETYGQEMGFSPVQVALRAGHDPSIAARHYTGKVAEADRGLAEAVASLLAPRA